MLDNLRLALFHATSWLARLILLTIATVMPWWYGGAQWQSQTWLVKAGMCLAVLTWLSALLSPRRTAGCVRLSYVMVAFMLLATVQVIPQPAFLTGIFSSSAQYVSKVKLSAEAVPVEGTDAATRQPSPAASSWSDSRSHNTISIAPLQTRASLAVLAVATVCLWSASTLLVSTRWTVVLAVVLALGGLANAFVGLLQLVNFAHATLLPMPNSESIFSTFVSRNSAPAYYATCVGATFAVLGLAFRSQKRKRRQEYRVTYPGTSWVGRVRNRMEDVFIDLNSIAVTCMCIVVFMLVAVLATSSRGGIIACTGACFVTLCLTLGSRGNMARGSVVAGATLIAAVGVLSLLEVGKPIFSRLDQINTIIHSGEDARLTVWGYVFHALPNYWLAGCGLGTFRFGLLPYHQAGPSVWFHHAESLPLEVLMETGLPGLALLVLAGWMIGQQLYVQSGLQKEQALLAGSIFASCAIGIQSLVDFSLILPGVFLPYCLLIGAFLGRCRRVEQDQARLEELGVDAFDARKVARLGVRIPSRGKLAGHTLVAVASLLVMFLGHWPLAGYAQAGKLADQLKKSDFSQTELNARFQKLIEDSEALEQSTKAALSQFPHHPEVGLVAAQVEHLLWRLSATTSIEWGTDYPLSTKWSFANPTTLALVLRSTSTELAPLRQAIQSDDYGMQLAAASFARFQRALHACPLDSRAAWGAYYGNLGWLTPQETNLLLENLDRLTGNNINVQVEIGILALKDGWPKHGLHSLAKAILQEPARLDRNTLKAIAGDVSFEELVKFFPADNVVAMAHTARALNDLATSTTEPVPPAGPLAKQLTDYVYPKLSQSIQGRVGLDGYDSLAWVARQKSDIKLEVRFMEQVSRLASESYPRRLQYAKLLYELGEKDKARIELERFLLSESPTAEVRSACQKQIDIWLGLVDPNT